MSEQVGVHQFQSCVCAHYYFLNNYNQGVFTYKNKTKQINNDNRLTQTAIRSKENVVSLRSASQLVIHPDAAIRKISVSYLFPKAPLHTGYTQHKQENSFCPMVWPKFQAPLLSTTSQPIRAAEEG